MDGRNRFENSSAMKVGVKLREHNHNDTHHHHTALQPSLPKSGVAKLLLLPPPYPFGSTTHRQKFGAPRYIYIIFQQEQPRSSPGAGQL
jgi:hypothetical protein